MADRNKFLASMVRACVTAPPGRILVAEDLSSIEARVNAWCANDVDFLELFRRNGDPYVAQAAALFNVPPVRLSKHPEATAGVDEKQRGLGKIIELACGYQQGAKKFKETAEDDGVDWSKLPVTQIGRASCRERV